MEKICAGGDILGYKAGRHGALVKWAFSGGSFPGLDRSMIMASVQKVFAGDFPGASL